ncbi:MULTISPECIES: isochorismate synthase MenF [unclassified Microbacterium]|uniref:isochorismate synthase n=1 Tax=unclassified Microbacterium TaxID=2609290 RepID=UPI000EA94580|nr:MULTISPECIES: isochorismate synthase [unclassified Microbacterium]MBT2483382.1 chorismate-binding protein [Microbacterium sp. ISL-108]RKN66414.1 isochorismate synthase [Microbacterium sp. CGR2]
MHYTHLVVETREIDPVEDLLAYADPSRPLAWLRRGDGIVSVGEPFAEIRPPAGADVSRAAALATFWRGMAAEAEIDDPIGLPGTGLVAFGAFTFDEESAADSVLILPTQIIGRHGGRFWRTRIRLATDTRRAEELPTQPYGPHWAGTVGPGAQSPQGYQDSVRHALARIADGEVSKVVLARDLTGSIPAGSDLRRLVRALSSGYPDTWAFAVDGLIGASPETLVTVRSGTVTARVLAGTIGRGADADADTAASAHLASSTKDLDEHQYAVQSVLASLRPHTRALAASEQPFLLKLPNLFHLATDVEGELADGESALDLVRVLHPTAAVAGTPTPAAIAAIRDLEPFDRGRYAGPVGWVDAAGNGEWAIALRCAQFTTAEDDIRVTAYAGAGIVAGSDPESELLETRVKFRPLVDALA